MRFRDLRNGRCYRGGMRHVVISAVLSLLLAGCAHMPPDLEELKPTVEAFHQRLKWRDFRGAAEIIVPEKRAAFIRGRVKNKDEEDFQVSEYQLEDAVTSGDKSIAMVVSRLAWVKLPSVSEQKVTITNKFVWRDKAWFLESQDSGPFPELMPGLGSEEKKAEEKKKEPAGKTER